MKTTSVVKRLLIVLILFFLTAVIVPVHAQPPAVGVCLSPSGTPSTCPPYMQIVNVDMAVSSGNYVSTIHLAEGIPIILTGDIPNPNRFLEWALLIDADRNNLTNPQGPPSILGPHLWTLMDFENDIGADYSVFLGLQGARQFSGGVQNLANGTCHSNAVQLTVGLQSIQFTFAPSSIGEAANFDFVVAVREYARAGDPKSLMVFDKAPNVGHYSFVGGVLTVAVPSKVFAASYQNTWTITAQTDPQKQPFASILMKYTSQDTAVGTLTLGVNVSLTYVNDATAHLGWIEFYDIAVHLRNTANGTDVAVSSTDSSHTRVNAGGQYTHGFSVRASQPGQYFVALTLKASTPEGVAYGLTISAAELSWDTGTGETATTGETPTTATSATSEPTSSMMALAYVIIALPFIGIIGPVQ